MMDDRERMEQYLAWRRAEGRDRRGRIRRRFRLAGALATLTLLLTALGIAVGGRPRLDKPDTAGARPNPTAQAAVAEPADPPARVTPSLSTRVASAPDPTAAAAPAPPAPSAARVTRKDLPPRPATARGAGARRASAPANTPTFGAASPPSSSEPSAGAPSETSPAAREVVVTPAPTHIVMVAPPPVVMVEPPAAAPTPAVAASDPAPPTPPTRLAPATSPPAPPSRMERLKELTGYMPEVWLARRVTRWVQQQPPGELSPAPPEQTQPQSR